MSRVGKNPIFIPTGVEVTIQNADVTVKGSKGTLKCTIPSTLNLKRETNSIKIEFDCNQPTAKMLAGTLRSELNNMVVGVSKGFERRLTLIGVGYRAAAQGKTLNLTLGFSHPVSLPMPEGITVETPTQTEIVIKGFDKRKVGQLAANIREYRMPEPYKGKGIRYVDEEVIIKEAKKK